MGLAKECLGTVKSRAIEVQFIFFPQNRRKKRCQKDGKEVSSGVDEK